MVACIGPETGPVMFALARRGVIAFAVDRYLERSARPDAAPAGMLVDPARYAPVPLPRGNLIGLHSYATRLNLPSAAFDGVLTLGVIERLGSLDEVSAAACEVARILKPGGVAAFATEFRVEGPDDRRWFDDRLMLFTQESLSRYVVEASGLTMRTPMSMRQSDATFETRVLAADFEARGDSLRAIAEKRAITPNLVLYHEGFLFCPAVITLHKDGRTIATDAAREARIAAKFEMKNAELAASLEQYQRTPTLPSQATSAPFLQEIERLRAEADWLRAAYERANAWKRWRVMRPARFIYHRIRRRRG